MICALSLLSFNISFEAVISLICQRQTGIQNRIFQSLIESKFDEWKYPFILFIFVFIFSIVSNYTLKCIVREPEYAIERYMFEMPTMQLICMFVVAQSMMKIYFVFVEY